MSFTKLPGNVISLIAENLNKRDVGSMALVGVSMNYVNTKKFSNIVPRKTAVVHFFPYLEYYLDYHLGEFENFLGLKLPYTAEFGLYNALFWENFDHDVLNTSYLVSDEQNRNDSRMYLEKILARAYPGDLIIAKAGSYNYPEGSPYNAMYMVSAFNTDKDVANEMLTMNSKPHIYPSLESLLEKGLCDERGCGNRFVYKLILDGSTYVTRNEYIPLHILSYHDMDYIEDLVEYFYPNITENKVLYNPEKYNNNELKEYLRRDGPIYLRYGPKDRPDWFQANHAEYLSLVRMNLLLSRRSRFLQKFANQLTNNGKNKDWVRFFEDKKIVPVRVNIKYVNRSKEVLIEIKIMCKDSKSGMVRIIAMAVNNSGSENFSYRIQ
jgi:hypothetical protein